MVLDVWTDQRTESNRSGRGHRHGRYLGSQYNWRRKQMTTELSNAMAQARGAVAGGLAETFVERLVGQIGRRASVEAAFGQPIEQGELTVVPVARVRWGFGGGSGGGIDAGGSGGSGSGGGRGVAVDAIGYLEIRPAGAIFQPISPPYPSPLFVLAAGLAAAIVVRSLARLVRR
jgi:hypothetical protein